MARTLSGATTPGQSGPGSDGNKGVLRIPQSSSITGTSLSGCLVSYLGHSLGVSYPIAEMQSVYSTTPADWAMYAYVFVYVCVLDGNNTRMLRAVFEVTLHKAAVVRPLTSHLTNFKEPMNKTCRHCWRSKDELISEVFLSYLPTPPLGQDMTQGQFFSGV